MCNNRDIATEAEVLWHAQQQANRLRSLNMVAAAIEIERVFGLSTSPRSHSRID